MASATKKPVHSVRQCGGMISRLAFRRAAAAGADAGLLLAQAGLSAAAIEDRSARIGVADQIRFVGLVAEALGDRSLGFHLAYEHDPRELGLLYYVAASADTLGDALRRMERYIDIQNEGVTAAVGKGRTVRVSFHYVGVARHTDIQQMNFIIASIIRICRQLTGRMLSPTHVRLMHRIGKDKAELERLLDSVIDDGAGADTIEFPAASWDLPIVSADPHLHRLCVQSCEEALAGRSKPASPLKINVENAIAELLPHGQARHALVAAKLGLSPRTLARRLSADGASFVQIQEEVRAALAKRYLADRTLTVSEIAWLLGYAEIGTFTRAYRRWTGMSPSAGRARSDHGAAAAAIAATTGSGGK